MSKGSVIRLKTKNALSSKKWDKSEVSHSQEQSI